MQSESIEVPTYPTQEYAQMPTYGSDYAAGADLHACIDPQTIKGIKPGETTMISVGIKTAIPHGYVGLVFARSGLSTKNDLAPANKVGVIDEDYRGEWFVPLHNHGSHYQSIKNGEKIAQVIFVKKPHTIFKKVNLEDLDETNRGEGGFGSTGKS